MRQFQFQCTNLSFDVLTRKYVCENKLRMFYKKPQVKLE